MSSVYQTQPPTDAKIILSTTQGPLEIELWCKQTPLACRNFIQLCLEGYYTNCRFHRIIPNYLVQSGDPLNNGGESIYNAPFKDEFHSRLRFSHRGILAMAGVGKDCNTSQFFFTLVAAPELDGKHTIFGKIGESELDGEAPVYPVLITDAQVLNEPFGDIVPRSTLEERELQRAIREEEQERQIKASKPKLKRNRKLLSFGDDEQEEVIPIAKRGIKSSHDVLDSSNLLSQAVDTAALASLPSKTQQESKTELARESKESATSESHLFAKERAMKLAILKQETDMLSRKLLESKRGIDKKVKKEKKLSLLEEMKSGFISKRSNIITKGIRGKKVVEDEDQLLSTLEDFKSRLGAGSSSLLVRKKAAPVVLDKPSIKQVSVCAIHSVEDCESCNKSVSMPVDEDDSNWKDNWLKFKKEKRADVYERKVDDYTFEDPREAAKVLK